MPSIAIMQPYFVPYAGYFRLFAEADLFVIYDCVQFPRRGFVHRNRLPDAEGRARWLTLPLAPAPRSARIADMAFAPDAAERFAARLRKFPVLSELPRKWSGLFDALEGPLVPWLEKTLALCCTDLGIACPTVRSSSLGISARLKGQDRIIEICQTLDATAYVNAPGGRHLYQEEVFRDHGIELRFLPPFNGSHLSVLSELLTAGPDAVRQEIARDGQGTEESRA